MAVLKIILEYREAYFSGLFVTLELCLIAWLIGIGVGSVVAFSAEWLPRLVGWPMNTLSRITEAIPILVLLFWLHYPVQTALGIVVDPFLTTAAMLTVLNSLAVFGILHRSICEVPKELIEVARVCGVARRRIFWSIKLPLALRSAAGPLTSAQVNVLQLSIFGSLISVGELFRTAQRVNAQIYKPIEVYTGVALFFLMVCLPLNLLARHLERRLT
jgi:polar amino acid transport system permease protein